MAGYFGHVPSYPITTHGMAMTPPNIDFFNHMGSNSCGMYSDLNINIKICCIIQFHSPTSIKTVSNAALSITNSTHFLAGFLTQTRAFLWTFLYQNKQNNEPFM